MPSQINHSQASQIQSSGFENLDNSQISLIESLNRLQPVQNAPILNNDFDSTRTSEPLGINYYQTMNRVLKFWQDMYLKSQRSQQRKEEIIKRQQNIINEQNKLIQHTFQDQRDKTEAGKPSMKYKLDNKSQQRFIVQQWKKVKELQKQLICIKRSVIFDDDMGDGGSCKYRILPNYTILPVEQRTPWSQCKKQPNMLHNIHLAKKDNSFIQFLRHFFGTQTDK